MARTHSDIVNLWPTARDLASDIETATGYRVKPERVRAWRQRNRIPSWWWHGVLAAAKRRRLGVTEAELALGMLKVNGRVT